MGPRCGSTSRLYEIHGSSACPGVRASITSSVPACFKNKKFLCGRPLAELNVVCTFILQSNYLDYLGQIPFFLTVLQLYSRITIHACTASIINCTWVDSEFRQLAINRSEGIALLFYFRSWGNGFRYVTTLCCTNYSMLYWLILELYLVQG